MEENNLSNEVLASELVETFMTEYGKHTLSTAIGHVIDGLKPVQRRIIWALRDTNEFKKVGTLTGILLDKFHIAGDASISSAITALTQPFNNIIPLVYTDKNCGSYSGDAAAAPRYLTVKAAKFSKDVYFNNVDIETFEYQLSDTQKEMEPVHLIPRIPIALMIGSFGIALAYKSDIQSISLKNLCIATLEYIKARRTSIISKPKMYDQLAKYFLPDFPTKCMIRNNNFLISKYKLGEFTQSVVMDGTMIIGPNTIIITSLPHGENVRNLYHLLGSMITDRKENLMNSNFQDINDISKGQMECRLKYTLKRNINPFDILDEFKKLIKFTKSWKPIPLLVNTNRHCSTFTPIDIIEKWYGERSRSILASLKRRQQRLIKRVRQYMALIVVRDHDDQLYGIFKSAEDVKSTIRPLMTIFGLSSEQAEFLSGLTFGAITSKGKEQLIKDKLAVEEEIKSLNNTFTKVPEIIINDVETIAKKHKQQGETRTVNTSFIGSVRIYDSGVIQVYDLQELDAIVSRFGSDNVEITLYPNSSKNKLSVVDGLLMDESKLDFPKEFRCSEFMVSKLKYKHSIGLRKDTIYRTVGINYRFDKDLKFIYVGDTFTSVSRSGIVNRISTTEIVSRQSIISTGVLTDIMYVSPIVSDDVIVVHCNTKEPNLVRIEKINVNDNSKLNKLPMGKFEILEIHKHNEDFIVSIPKKYLKRCNIRHLYIPKNTIEGAIRIDLSKKKVNDNRKVVKINRTSSVYEIK